MFKSSVFLTEQSSDKEIIICFYQAVQNEIKENPEREEIEEPIHLTELWKEYISSLPENLQDRTHSLSYVVINEPQVLPKNFTYLEAIKAIFILAIPDLALDKHLNIQPRGRNSPFDLYQNNAYEEQENGDYLITVPERIRRDRYAFERFIINHEKAFEENSPLNSFSSYLNSIPLPSMQTFHDYSLQFIEHFVGKVYSLLEDPKLKQALIAADLSILEQITFLHEVMSSYLNTYTLEKCPSSLSEKDQMRSLTESLIVKRAQDIPKKTIIINHNNVALKINYKFNPDVQSRESPIQQYRNNALRNVELGVHSILSGPRESQSYLINEDAERQNYIYSAVINFRNAIINQNEDLPTHRQLLGASEEQDYSDFINDDYTLSFACTRLSSSVSNDDFLMHFFLDNIALLRQLDDQEDRDIFKISVERFWNTFIIDKYCPKKIKNRRIILTKSPTFSTVVNVISKICKPELLDPNIIRAFSNLLSSATRDKKYDLLIAFAKALFVDPGQLSEAFDEGLSRIIKEVKALNKKAAEAMRIIWNSSIRRPYKLAFIDAIAAVKLRYSQEHHMDFYNTFQLSLEEIQKEYDFAKTSKKDLPTLIEEYKLAKERNLERNIISIISEIEKKCNGEQLDILGIHLKKFSAPSNHSAFFPRALTPSVLQEIIHKIENKKHGAFDILLELKQTAQKSMESVDDTSHISKLHQTINQFFSGKNTTQDKTMDELLESISQIENDCAIASLPGVSTFSH